MPQTKDSLDGDNGVLRAIVESTSDAIFAKDLAGRYIMVNAACASFLGRSKGEILGRRDADLYPPDTARQFVADDEEVLRAGSTLVFEGKAAGPGGEQSYRVTKGVVRDARGEVVGVFGISHDMTERRRAERERLERVRAEAAHAEAEAAGLAKDDLLQELQESEARYRSLLENANDIIYSHDLEGNYLAINRAAEETTGYSREEILGGLNIAEVVAPDHLERARAMIQRKLVDPSSTVYEVDIITKGGQRRTLEVSTRISLRDGATAAIEGIARDVTERKRIEREREELLEREQAARDEAEKRLRESVKLSALYYDLARSLELSEVSATICRTVRDLVGADGAAFIVREGDEVHYADIDAIAPLWEGQRFPAASCVSGWTMIERRPAVIEDVYADDRVPKDAYLPTFVKSMMMVPVRAANPVGAIGAYWAERRRATEDEVRVMQALASAADLAFANAQLYEQTKKARLDAEAANRLKDEFLATLSHELRTPLTAIIGWAHMMEGEMLDQETAQQAVAVIRRNAEQQRRIIEDILDASRVVTGKLKVEVEPIRLAPIVEEAIDSVRPAATAKGIELGCSLDSGADTIQGDPHRLRQVVWNLLSNAIKFTQAGGRVKVELERLLTHLRIAVSDTGQGIAPDFLPFVFDRFRQADGSTTRQHGGLGLGLSIVRHLVEAHGGAVHAYSAGEGQGATFTVDLPLPVEPQAREAQANTARREAGKSAVPAPVAGAGAEGGRDVPPALVGLRVMLVDDDEDALTLLAVLLRRQGAEVSAASSTGAALRLLEEVRPDVLVSDVGMPGEDGYALMRRVRALTPERGGLTPAIALTAYAGDSDRTQALRAGFHLHMPKPIDPAALIEAITGLAGLAARSPR